MLHRTIALALSSTAALLITASEAQAWGAVHAGYTHVGPAGVQHYGYTAARGPYGGYSAGHVSAYGYGGGAYRAGYGYGGYGGYNVYSPGYGYGGAAVGGYHYGYGGVYGAGVYRRY